MISQFSIQLASILAKIPTVSPSQLDVWVECPQRWDYAYSQQLKRISSGAFHMDRGNYVHRLMHYYYNLLKLKYRPGSPTVLAAMLDKMAEDRREITIETMDILTTSQGVVKEYLEQRSKVIDASIVVEEVEYEFYVLVHTPKGRYVFLHGYIDLVYRDIYHRLRVRDHKSTERSDSWTESKIKFNNQLLHYILAMTKLYREPVVGAEINVINLAKKPAKRFDLLRVSHEDTVIVNYENNLMKILDKMFDKETHRNYSGSCGGCPYFKLCELESKNLSTASTISTLFERTNRGNKPGLVISTSGETVQRPADPKPAYKEIDLDIRF